MSIWLPDEAATKAFARRLADALPASYAGWMVLLEGELGAGKSTLARALLRAWGHKGAAPSPTYTLVEPYELSGGNVYHIDLYRVSDAAELRYLGWTEFDDGLRLVEWPDRAASLTDTADLCIALSYDGDGRVAVLTGLTPRGKEIAAALDPPPGLSQ